MLDQNMTNHILEQQQQQQQQQSHITSYQNSLPVNSQTQTNTEDQLVNNIPVEIVTNQHSSNPVNEETMYGQPAFGSFQNDYLNPLFSIPSFALHNYANYHGIYNHINPFIGNNQYSTEIIAERQPYQPDLSYNSASSTIDHSTSLLYSDYQDSTSTAKQSFPLDSAEYSQMLTSRLFENKNQDHNMPTFRSLNQYPHLIGPPPHTVPSFSPQKKHMYSHQLSSGYPCYDISPYKMRIPSLNQPLPLPLPISYASNPGEFPSIKSHESDTSFPPALNEYNSDTSACLKSENNLQREDLIESHNEVFANPKHTTSDSKQWNFHNISSDLQEKPINNCQTDDHRFLEKSYKNTSSDRKFTALGKAFIYFIKFCKTIHHFPYIMDSNPKVIELLEKLTEHYFRKFFTVLNFVKYPILDDAFTRRSHNTFDFKVELKFRGPNLFCHYLGVMKNINKTTNTDHVCIFGYDITIDIKVKSVGFEQINLHQFNRIMMKYFGNNIDLLEFKPFMDWSPMGMRMVDINVKVKCDDLTKH